MLKKINRLFHQLEDASLIFLISSLLLISILQIVLRNLNLGGLTWADEAMRTAVLWLAFFGALRASRLQNHIAINLLVHFKNTRLKRVIHFFVSNFCALVCALAAFYCWRFISLEYEDGQTGFLGIPVWFLESIIPFALTLIAVRFISQSTQLPSHNDPHYYN